MDSISVTVTGHLYADPRLFDTRNGAGVSIWLAAALDSGPGRDDAVRYFQVVAFGPLASHAASSLRRNDRVTVRSRDVQVDKYPGKDGEERTVLKVVAYDIAASLRNDTALTGRAARRASSAAGGQPPAGPALADLPAAEQADLAVLAGVTSAPQAA